MPRRIAASATRLPIFPKPITPSVCPGSSMPANCFFPSSIFFSKSEEEESCLRTKSKAGARLRAAISIPASTSSFTALAFAPGALKTGMPRLESAATGILLTPAPARPTARSEGPNSCLCRSAERTRIAQGSLDSLTTAYRSAGRRFNPTWAMLFSTSTSHFFCLAMLRFELLHVLHEGLHPLDWHGVVDRCAHPADRPVAFQLDHAALRGAFEEFFIQLGILEGERNVHARTIFLRDRIPEEGAAVEKVIEQLGFLNVELLDRRQAPKLLQPFEHQAGD